MTGHLRRGFRLITLPPTLIERSMTVSFYKDKIQPALEAPMRAQQMSAIAIIIAAIALIVACAVVIRGK